MNVQRIEKESMDREQSTNKPVIILASSSINRRKILRNLELSFESISAGIEEEKITAVKPPDLVCKISRQKAEAIVKKLPPKGSYLVIAADTIAFFEGKILGKPANKNEAIKMLHLLSGKTHYCYTGICVIDTESQKVHQDCAETAVTFKKLTAEEIENYVNTQPVTTKAGGYDICKGSPGEKFLAEIRGSYTNVLGLPLEILLPILDKYDIKYQDSLLT